MFRDGNIFVFQSPLVSKTWIVQSWKSKFPLHMNLFNNSSNWTWVGNLFLNNRFESIEVSASKWLDSVQEIMQRGNTSMEVELQPGATYAFDVRARLYSSPFWSPQANTTFYVDAAGIVLLLNTYYYYVVN